MNPHEEAIDKVLAALRDAPVPQHLDRRILNSIEEAHQSQRNTFFGNIIPNEAPRGRSPVIPAFPATRTALACWRCPRTRRAHSHALQTQHHTGKHGNESNQCQLARSSRVKHSQHPAQRSAHSTKLIGKSAWT